MEVERALVVLLRPTEVDQGRLLDDDAVQRWRWLGAARARGECARGVGVGVGAGLAEARG